MSEQTDPKVVSDVRPIHDRLGDELSQSPLTRRRTIQEIEALLGGRTVVTYFTSSVYPVVISDSDADMLESVLRSVNSDSGLTLILNSPGGDALAAERIIRVCRVYSGGDFEVLVPKAAKSAATMIALGANRILMSRTSELGPIDPQVIWGRGDRQNFMPAHAIIAAYENLLEQATTLTMDGRIEPYLQQLDQYDASEITQMRKLSQLSKDIARQSLQTGMLSERADSEISACVDLFTDWDRTLTHGRSIFPETMIDSGLNVTLISEESELWDKVFDLYMRTEYFVSTSASKTIESTSTDLSVPPPNYR